MDITWLPFFYTHCTNICFWHSFKINCFQGIQTRIYEYGPPNYRSSCGSERRCCMSQVLSFITFGKRINFDSGNTAWSLSLISSIIWHWWKMYRNFFRRFQLKRPTASSSRHPLFSYFSQNVFFGILWKTLRGRVVLINVYQPNCKPI